MFQRILTAVVLLACIPSVSLVAGGPSGRWVGTWSSSSTGHNGPLRATIRQVDNDTYRAMFAGRFAKVVPFVYPAKLDRVPGTCNCFQSSTRLPLMGEYRMTAKISSGQFRATYHSKRDVGEFRMSAR